METIKKYIEFAISNGYELEGDFTIQNNSIGLLENGTKQVKHYAEYQLRFEYDKTIVFKNYLEIITQNIFVQAVAKGLLEKHGNTEILGEPGTEEYFIYDDTDCNFQEFGENMCEIDFSGYDIEIILKKYYDRPYKIGLHGMCEFIKYLSCEQSIAIGSGVDAVQEFIVKIVD